MLVVIISSVNAQSDSCEMISLAVNSDRDTIAIIHKKSLSKQVFTYFNDNKWTLTGCFIAGALDGTVEILRHDYDNFKAVFPDANDTFWLPQLSWHNKWKNGNYRQGEKFPGSSTFLVWTTDGYHLLRTLERTTVCFSFAIKIGGKKQNWKNYVADALIHQVFYAAGDYLTYQLIFKH